MNDESFEAIAEEVKQELVMRRCMRGLEQLYFPGVPPVADLEVVDMLDPALMTEDRVIRISSAASRWTKLGQVLILHELIHNSLLHKFGDPDELEGDPDELEEEKFQGEVQRLWGQGSLSQTSLTAQKLPDLPKN